MSGAPPGEIARFEADALLFDLDGVMVRSASSIERAWRAWASDHGLAWRDVEPHVHGRLAVDTISALLPGLSRSETERQAREVNDRQVCDTSDVEPVAGVRELVAALPPSGWAVVTACPRDLALARLRAGGYAHPPALVTFEDVERGKPDPEGFLAGAEKLSVQAARCVVLEDSPSGVAAAKAAGMIVVGLATTHDAGALAGADAVAPDGRWLQVQRLARGLSLALSGRPVQASPVGG